MQNCQGIYAHPLADIWWRYLCDKDVSNTVDAVILGTACLHGVDSSLFKAVEEKLVHQEQVFHLWKESFQSHLIHLQVLTQFSHVYTQNQLKRPHVIYFCLNQLCYKNNDSSN